jgi:hypothetical protein
MNIQQNVEQVRQRVQAENKDILWAHDKLAEQFLGARGKAERRMGLKDECKPIIIIS